MKPTIVVCTAMLFFTTTAFSKEAVDANCSALATADLSGIVDAPTQLTSTVPVEATDSLPAYCEVKGYVAPSVGIKLALPTQWNGKFMQGGCGGHCGSIDKGFEFVCGGPLRKGYACIISDMGHKGTGSDGLWAYNNLQAKVDWGYRSTHVTAVAGKAITERFYSRKPAKSYFSGCSTGGRQALQEAQRFPWDFDGIIAGAPPVDLSTIYMAITWGMRAAQDESGAPLLTERELKLLTDAAVAKCDKEDGLQDGIIGDPLHCRFEPRELACVAGRSGQCLSSAQIEAARKIYAGPMNSAGEKLSPGGPLPGSEYGSWTTAYVSQDGHPPLYSPLVASGLQYLFFWPEPGPAWSFKDFDFDRDYRRMGMMEVLTDSSNPDLRKFKAAGGKLLIYQGTIEPSVLPRAIVDYYETVKRTMGGKEATESFARLFMLPGMAHCAGGPGADTVDYLSYLEAWVEQGQAPQRMIAARLKDRTPVYLKPPKFPLDPAAIEFSRPVYPYPATAKYRGRGDPNDAASFAPAGGP